MELTISILGFGNIGKLLGALLLPYRQFRLQLNVMDPDPLVKGAFLDLQHSAQLYPHHRLSYNSQRLFEQSDFIFHCAGASVPIGKSRLEVCAKSIEITESIFNNVSFQKAPFLIVLANPVDLITHFTQKVTALPKSKVMGTGTLLDSIRMNFLIQQKYPKLKEVNAVLLGEHGSSVFLSKQLSSIQGKPFIDYLRQNEIDEIMNSVKSAADEIKETQGATLYGASFCALKVFEALLLEKEQFMPLSSFPLAQLKEQLRKTDLCLSLPTYLSAKGARVDKNYLPKEDELKKLGQSLQSLESCLGY
ncbi:MAG: hypothetical protein RIC95_05325 [Vicingaceae bacterium]